MSDNHGCDNPGECPRCQVAHLRSLLRASEAEVSRLTAANAALVDLCEEYQAQWGDDYLAKKWGLKEALKAIKGASFTLMCRDPFPQPDSKEET